MALFTAGCSEQKTPEQIIAQAKTATFTKKDPGEAIVILKKLLQEQPQNATAREGLAVAYTVQGDYLESLSQFQRIKDAAISPDGLRFLAETYYFVQANSLIDETFTSQITPELADVSFLVAFQTLKSSGDLSLLNDLSQGSTSEAISELAAATVEFHRTKNPLDYIATTSDIDIPSNFTWFTNTSSASLLSNIGDSQQAIPMFEAYLDARPFNGKARLLYAEALVEAGQFDKAKVVVDKILAGVPGQVLANRLKALIDFENNELESAKAAIDTSIQNGYTIPSNFIISGTISYQLGNYEQAVNELERGVVMFPPNSVYHKMLASASLQLGDSESSLALLFDQSLLRSTIDIQNFNLLLDELNRSGNDEGVLNLLSSLTYDDKMDIESRMRFLAVKGQHSSSSSAESLTQQFAQLANSLDINESQKIKVHLLTAISMLQAGQYEEILELISEWKEDHDVAIFAGVESEALKLLGRYSDLIDKYGDQVESSQDSSLIRNIAFSYYQSDQFEKAHNASLYALRLMPSNIEVLREVVRIQKRADLRDDQQVLDILSLNDAPASSNMLVALYYSMYEEFTKAEDILLKVDKDSHSAIYYYTLAEVQVRLNKNIEAARNARLAAEQENISLAQTPSLILLLSQLKEQKAAQNFLYNQLKKYPVSSDLNFIAAQDKAGSGNLEEASNYINLIENPSAKIMLFHSQLLLRKSDFDGALKMANSAFKKEANENTLFNLSEMLETLGQQNNSITVLSNYISEHPDAVNPRLLLAEKYRIDQAQKAKPLYESVLSIDETNIYALTNLATVSKALGEYQAAKDYAKKALDLYPNNEAVKSTYDEIHK